MTYDHQKFYEVGHTSVFEVKLGRNYVVNVPGDEDWEPHVKEYMHRVKFWPSVWFVSDHGNAHRLSLEGK